MANIALYTKAGGKSSSKFNAPKTLFGTVPKNHELLKVAYLADAGNGRQNAAFTKTRGEVRGGGRKPHPQKGTGRARAGTIRSPIWRGGGITFGPRGEENYTRQLNKSSKVTALTQALSLSAEAGRIAVIDDFVTDGKTANAAKLLAKLGFERGTVVLSGATEETSRSLRNIKAVKLVDASRLNAADVLNAVHLLLSKSAVEVLEQRVGSKS